MLCIGSEAALHERGLELITYGVSGVHKKRRVFGVHKKELGFCEWIISCVHKRRNILEPHP